MKTVITKISFKSKEHEEDITPESIEKYKKDIYQLIRSETDAEAEIEISVEIV